MKKKRGNPNWAGRNCTPPSLSSQTPEEVVKKLRLSPSEYESSIQLQDWARNNKDQKYVPSTLLQAWGLDVKEDS